MSIITIPAGLLIFDREIDIEIQYHPDEHDGVMRLRDGIYTGEVKFTEPIRDALEAAAKYQAEIGE